VITGLKAGVNETSIMVQPSRPDREASYSIRIFVSIRVHLWFANED
jgi:hypothetical protein